MLCGTGFRKNHYFTFKQINIFDIRLLFWRIQIEMEKVLGLHFGQRVKLLFTTVQDTS